MAYRFNIGMEAAAVPELLELWLDDSLPADFTVKRGVRQGRRLIEVTISGSTLQDVQAKRAALVKTIRQAGFEGMVFSGRQAIEE